MLAAAAAVPILGGCASVGVDAGLFAMRDRDPEGVPRLRVAGPVAERRVAEDGRKCNAIRPFFSELRLPGEGRHRYEVLWPAGVRKRFHDDVFARFLNVYYSRFGEAPDARHRFVIFPVFFNGRDKHEERYTAVFPLGGRIHEYLGQDRLGFVLFPLYGFSAVDEVRTHHVLWPVFSRTTGEGVRRFRVFPLYGESEREGRWEKRFVLWPLWTSARYPGAEQGGGGFLLFPLYGQARVGPKAAWTVLPPLFRYATGPAQRDLQCPWPFIQWASGEVEKLYIWPLWGRREHESLRTAFALWPIGHRQRIARPGYVLQRTMVLPVFYSETRTARAAAREGEGAGAEPATAGRTTARYWKVWPLAAYRREGETVRFRVLALWPLKHSPPIERNYAPFWSLYTHTRTADVVEDEVLWGLWRRRREGLQSRTRVLYFFTFGSRTAAESGEKTSP